MAALQPAADSMVMGWFTEAVAKGEAKVVGCDIRRPNGELFDLIGVSFETPSVYLKLAGLENLRSISLILRTDILLLANRGSPSRVQCPGSFIWKG